MGKTELGIFFPPTLFTQLFAANRFSRVRTFLILDAEPLEFPELGIEGPL